MATPTTQTQNPQVVKMTRNVRLSYIFTVYAKAKKAAKLGAIDGGRLNKALGIVLSNHYQTSTGEDYITTLSSCNCPDFEYRTSAKRKASDGQRYTGPCKHIISVMIETRVNEIAREKALAESLFGKPVIVQ